MDKNFGGVIWTNHVLDRLKERDIKQSDAWTAFNSPDSSRKASTPGAFIYYKKYGNERLEVVAAKNKFGKWVIMSVWLRPLFQEISNKKRASFWDNFLESLLRKVFRKG